MAALHAGEYTSLSGDEEAQPEPPIAGDRNRGGWGSAPFILATVFGMTLAGGGWSSNLLVFLINEFHIKSIDAAQISSVVSGCINFFPLVSAVVADSLLGCFSVIWVSSLTSLLAVEGLKPPPCEAASDFCAAPSGTQYAVLYTAISLATIGVSGMRYNLATMGAKQFSLIKHQSTFFNWYFFGFYTACLLSSTGIVYLQDNVGFEWGFGIGIASNALSLALFLIATPYYTRDEPRGSPLTGLLCVVVASIRKRKTLISSQAKDYYYGDAVDEDEDAGAPTNWLRPLNRAALKTKGDILPNGSIATPWKLCSVEQVEDLKSLIKILPLWSSGIFLATPISIQLSITVLQALASDRRLSRSFDFSAGFIPVFAFISSAIGITLIDRCLRPLWKKTAGNNPTPLQLIGIGNVFNIACMAVSALVESRRRSSAMSSSSHLMSVMWLVPQMVIVGVGEAFILPAQVGLYYQEFPNCLKSLSTAMVAMLLGVAFYLSTALVDFIRRITDWLPDDINEGRVDNVYWVMVVIGILNFGYFLVISSSYNYKNVSFVNKDQIGFGDD